MCPPRPPPTKRVRSSFQLFSFGVRSFWRGAARVSVTGNIKFDVTPTAAALALATQLRERAGERPVVLAASTREGEEALVLAAWRKVAASGALPVPLLVIVPRHPQRFPR